MILPASLPQPDQLLYIWHASDTPCGPLLKALSRRVSLQFSATPAEAVTKGNKADVTTLLLYAPPEQLYCRMLSEAPDAEAILDAGARWCQQAQNMLDVQKSCSGQVQILNISQPISRNTPFVAQLDLQLPPPEQPPKDPLRQILALGLVAETPGMASLAAQLTHYAAPAGTKDVPPGNLDHAKAALQACCQPPEDPRPSSAPVTDQTALLLEQKNLMQSELETLERMHQNTTEEMSKHLAGKEKALQTISQRLCDFETRNAALQSDLAKYRAQAIETQAQLSEIQASRSYKAIEFLRSRAPTKRNDK